MRLDARWLNKLLEPYYAQAPTIDEVLSRIEETKWFAKLDVTKAFWKINLNAEP